MELDVLGKLDKAVWFAWSYPVAHVERAGFVLHATLEDLSMACATDAFLLWGGLVFFDQNLEIVQILTVGSRQHHSDMRMMCFSRPIPVEDKSPLWSALAIA